jgi:hypothetical protein
MSAQLYERKPTSQRPSAYSARLHLACIAECQYFEDCRADPRLCSMHPLRSRRVNDVPNGAYGALFRLPALPRRRSWLATHKSEAFAYGYCVFAVAYITWAVGAAIVEGRLPVPWLR